MKKLILRSLFRFKVISLGCFSGEGLPNVYVQPTVFDWVLRVLSVLTVLCIWVLIGVFHKPLGGISDVYLFGGAGIFVTLLFLWTDFFVPVRLYNFPVRVNEQNIWRQMFLAKRLLRVMSVVLNLIFLFHVMALLETFWGIQPGLFKVLNFIILVVIGVLLIVYYVMANRWK